MNCTRNGMYHLLKYAAVLALLVGAGLSGCPSRPCRPGSGKRKADLRRRRMAQEWSDQFQSRQDLAGPSRLAGHGPSERRRLVRHTDPFGARIMPGEYNAAIRCWPRRRRSPCGPKRNSRAIRKSVDQRVESDSPRRIRADFLELGCQVERKVTHCSRGWESIDEERSRLV